MSENPEPNIPLLRKCVEWAEAEAAKPFELSEWDQASWYSPPETRLMRDRTAGNIVLRGSDNRALEVAEINPSCGTSFCIAGYACEVSGLQWRGETGLVLVDGEWVHASEAAESLLGITQEQSDLLFSGSNTIEEVRLAAEGIAGERL